MDLQSKLFKPLEKGSISEKIINRITEAIISRELKPGDKIPTEVEFSEKLGVGRNSVREATQILVAYGVLEIRRSEGTFVVKKFNQKMLEPLIYGILLENGSMLQLLELKITFLRSILYIGIEKAKDEDIEKLREKYKLFCEVTEKYPDNVEKLYIANMNFHKCLADATNNPLIIHFNQIVIKMSKYSRIKGIERAMFTNGLKSLTDVALKLLNLIEKRDMNHIEPVINEIFELWNEIVL
ncbi:MAG TPA: GntR family transcriptional regulator [Halanaerobiales bacterium]|nr:GntR family transcriptional regulator [Halanaerobiales bacterium]